VYIGLFSSQWSLFQVLSSVVQVSSTDPPLNCDSFALFGTEAAKPCGGCLLASQLYLTAQLQQLVPLHIISIEDFFLNPPLKQRIVLHSSSCTQELQCKKGRSCTKPTLPTYW
jgi:hypothetical protein